MAPVVAASFDVDADCCGLFQCNVGFQTVVLAAFSRADPDRVSVTDTRLALRTPAFRARR